MSKPIYKKSLEPLLKRHKFLTDDNNLNVPYIKSIHGIEEAKSMGFTHTNPAKTYFDDDNQMISRKPKSTIKETK